MESGAAMHAGILSPAIFLGAPSCDEFNCLQIRSQLNEALSVKVKAGTIKCNSKCEVHLTNTNSTIGNDKEKHLESQSTITTTGAFF